MVHVIYSKLSSQCSHTIQHIIPVMSAPLIIQSGSYGFRTLPLTLRASSIVEILWLHLRLFVFRFHGGGLISVESMRNTMRYCPLTVTVAGTYMWHLKCYTSTRLLRQCTFWVFDDAGISRGAICNTLYRDIYIYISHRFRFRSLLYIKATDPLYSIHINKHTNIVVST